MAIQKTYIDGDGDHYSWSVKDCEFAEKIAKTHNFEVITISTIKKIENVAFVRCIKCKVSGYQYPNDKFIIYNNKPLVLNCDELIIKGIIE